MKNRPKELKAALEKIDELPDNMFGSESASFEDLPSVKAKKNIIRTSTYIKESDLKYLKTISKNTHVPVAQLTGEIISKFVKDARTRTE